MLNSCFAVSVPDPIYAKVEVKEVDLNVQLRKCWATPSPSPTDPLSFVFIDDFQATGTDDMAVTANCDSGSSASFWIESFVFSDREWIVCPNISWSSPFVIVTLVKHYWFIHFQSRPKLTTKFICIVTYTFAMARMAKTVHAQLAMSASVVRSWKKNHTPHSKLVQSTCLSKPTIACG